MANIIILQNLLIGVINLEVDNNSSTAQVRTIEKSLDFTFIKDRISYLWCEFPLSYSGARKLLDGCGEDSIGSRLASALAVNLNVR